MDWNHIIGQKKVVDTLKDSILENRISHAQLFIGKSGYGSLALALAYCTEILNSENPNNYNKLQKFVHPDLYFSFPTIKDSSKEALSSYYLSIWREFLTENPYQNLNDWYEKLQVDNKQGIINVKEIESILSKVTLKSVEGGYKIIIIWMVERMNIEASNKFLKLLEEPPEKTLFILIAEDEEKLLQTILSRCQIIKINRIEEQEIENNLIKNNINDLRAKEIIHLCNGDWNSALKLTSNINENQEFENYLITWTRSAFKAKKDAKQLKNIHELSLKLSSLGREKQKKFFDYSTEIFRQALMQNYIGNKLVYLKLSQEGFNWEAFSKYIHGANIKDILDELSNASYYIERNANPKIIFLNTLISMTRFIHAKILK